MKPLQVALLIVIGACALALLIMLAMTVTYRGEDCPPGEVAVWSPGKWVCVRKGG
jgi:hypothetical protein